MRKINRNLNLKYRNLRRRHIHPQQVTKYDQFTNDDRIPLLAESEDIPLPKSYSKKHKIRKSLKI